MIVGLNPFWNEVLFFKVHVPELAFVIFTVLVKNVFIAQYTIPYLCMQQGNYFLYFIILLVLIQLACSSACLHYATYTNILLFAEHIDQHITLSQVRVLLIYVQLDKCENFSFIL